MSLQASSFQLNCDAKGCNAKLVAKSADEIAKRGWKVYQNPSDFEERSWIELDDSTFCPNHEAENAKRTRLV